MSSRKPNKGTIINSIKHNNEESTDTQIIAEKFNTHFTEISPTLSATVGKGYLNKFEDYVSTSIQPPSQKFTLHQVTPKVISKILMNMSPSKATGLDNIPCKLLKIGVEVISESLTTIFNAAISKGTFPTDWKLASVSPIFKSGNKDDPNNYRSISVIQAVAKAFEKSIYDQLDTYLNENKLLSNLQIDSTLSWNEHIHYISKKVSSAIGTMKRIRPYVNQPTLITMYHSWIQPHFDYCSEVWGDIGVVLSSKLQKLPHSIPHLKNYYIFSSGTTCTLAE